MREGGGGGVSIALVGGIVGGIILLAIIVALLFVYFRRQGCGSGKEESVYETVKPDPKLKEKRLCV